MRLLATSLGSILLLSATAATADPLVGKWTLNPARSHYGGGAEHRQQETFTCRLEGAGVSCTIESVRADGRRLVGQFSAPYDGKRHPAGGIPDVDEVALEKSDEFVVDATFSFQGKAVFAYRAVRSDDGRYLTIVSVDPATRAVLNSVVAYDGN